MPGTGSICLLCDPLNLWATQAKWCSSCSKHWNSSPGAKDPHPRTRAQPCRLSLHHTSCSCATLSCPSPEQTVGARWKQEHLHLPACVHISFCDSALTCQHKDNSKAPSQCFHVLHSHSVATNSHVYLGNGTSVSPQVAASPVTWIVLFHGLK